MIAETGQCVLSGNVSKSGQSVRLHLRKTREAMGFTQREAGAILGLTSRSVRRWENGSVEVADFLVEAAIRKLRHCHRPPGATKREALKKSHHLFWEEHRGWTLRFTLERDRKLVGQRMKFRLKTHQLDEAIERRELLVGMLRKFGLKISDRRQKKRSNDQGHRPDDETT